MVIPVEADDISKQLQKSFEKNGINVMTNSEVTSVEKKSTGVNVRVMNKKKEQKISADVLLSAVGVKSNIEGIGLEEVGIAVDKDKIIAVSYTHLTLPTKA